jgi:hypothetical protein
MLIDIAMQQVYPERVTVHKTSVCLLLHVCCAVLHLCFTSQRRVLGSEVVALDVGPTHYLVAWLVEWLLLDYTPVQQLPALLRHPAS